MTSGAIGHGTDLVGGDDVQVPGAHQFGGLHYVDRTEAHAHETARLHDEQIVTGLNSNVLKRVAKDPPSSDRSVRATAVPAENDESVTLVTIVIYAEAPRSW